MASGPGDLPRAALTKDNGSPIGRRAKGSLSIESALTQGSSKISSNTGMARRNSQTGTFTRESTRKENQTARGDTSGTMEDGTRASL